MIARPLARLAGAALVASTVLSFQAAHAQQQPSAAQIALAKEVIEVKGAAAIFAPLVTGVVEQTRQTIQQSNPMIAKDLGDVATQLRSELAPRGAEVQNEIVRLYAQKFSEPELKEILAFYKSPVGRKVITEEPVVLDEGMKRASEWADKLAEEVLGKFRTELRKKGHNL
jgi:hypothetical protein